MLHSDTILLQKSSKMAAYTHSRTQSDDTSTVNPNDPPSCGISSSGEPLEMVVPLGKRIASLPFKRRVDFRLFPDGKPILKDLKEASRNTAAWAQTRGIQVLPSCDYCAAGNGPFASCVVIRNKTGQRIFEGTCANCQFGRRGPKCSLRGFYMAYHLAPFANYIVNNSGSVTSSTMPSDGLLKEFQLARPTSDAQVHREVNNCYDKQTPNQANARALVPVVHKSAQSIRRRPPSKQETSTQRPSSFLSGRSNPPSS